MNLDHQQQAAATTDSKSALVIAGAGSGKTRTLIERQAYLMEDWAESKASPYEIVCLTFTRKAAQEMKERLAERIGKRAHQVTMGTMHAIALQMVTRFGEVLGLRPASVTVYGEWEEVFLLKEVARELGIWKGAWKVPKKDIDLLFSDYYERGALPDKESKAKPLFDAFMARCRENNSLTYGGLLLVLEQLIPVMARHLHFRHVLVDEVQDIDPLQWRIINGLCEAFRASLFVVGDVRQSIYSFRGAVPEYLLEHQSEFDIYELQNNYRSVTPIVFAANKLMSHSTSSMGGGMVPTRGDEPSPVECLRDSDSAALSEEVAGWDGFDYNSLTILARNHALLKRLDEELTQRGVPHTYIGRKTSLIESEPFRKFHAFLKLTVNPYDNFEFLLIRDVLEMNAKDYAQVRYYAASKGMSHFQAWKELNDPCSSWLQFFSSDSDDLCDALDALELQFDRQKWIEEPLEFAFAALAQNQTISNYLSWLATYDSQDEYDDAQGVTLATIHAAKGLEWPVVIVAGCNEGILPSKRSLGEGGLEEERRLMYVAMTRARDQLILAVRPEVTEKNGKLYENPISRFVAEALE